MKVSVLSIPWRACLHETALLLGEGSYETGFPREASLVLGAHAQPHVDLPEGSVIFNTEHPSTWNPAFRELMARFPTIHYSSLIPGVHCPLGFSESFPKVTLKPERDIDVLFFGSMSPRRAKVLRECSARGLKVQALFGVFGKELESYVARAKVVLNVHYYTEPACFEYARVVPLLHSGVCVVTEDSPEENLIGHSASYEDLADECAYVVKHNYFRRSGEIDKDFLEETSMSENLTKALKEVL